MRFYVASAIHNRDEVHRAFALLTERGHEVTTDWTLTDSVPEAERERSSDLIATLARRDHDGIRQADVFVILSEPSEGRSMYVELGVAIALHETRGSPRIFVLGVANTESIFYFHPAVQRVTSWQELLDKAEGSPPQAAAVDVPDGRLEEYRALRAEMLEIIYDRIWGQATYAVLAAGVLAFATRGSDQEAGLLFLIGLALPFLFHTIFREHARIRMGNYLRVVVEPRIPGMYWEEYLGLWRGKFGARQGEGWLTRLDRAQHIFALSGVYLLTSVFAWLLLLARTCDALPVAAGTALLALLFLNYYRFFRLYDKGAAEHTELKRLEPRP